MAAKGQVSKWGTSLAVRIPKVIAQQWGVTEGSAIELVPDGDALMLRKRSLDLEDLLDRITPENLHQEQDWGAARGAEAW